MRTANAVVDRYESMIVTEHEDSCLWRKRGCDETIYRLQLANPTVSRPAFTARYTSLLKIRNEIPPSLSHPELDLCSIRHSPEATDDGPIYEAAVILALFGWQNEDPSIPSLVTCSACFRRLGLWLFRKKAIKLEETLDSMEGLETEEEASVSRLDVIGEHREVKPPTHSLPHSALRPLLLMASHRAVLSLDQLQFARQGARLAGASPRFAAEPEADFECAEYV